MRTSTRACGCCEPPVAHTPHAIDNRPGLPAIRYRVGTFGSFRQAMIEAAARQPELRDWRSRAPDDFAMAVLAMWAWIGDVLTFYQERTANEAYVRTALLPESVRRLAGLLGYEPAPGVAAGADLVFVLDDGKEVVLPAGMLVQSVPGEGERPQPFETGHSVAADARLNEVPIVPAPHPRQGGALAAGSSSGLLLGPAEVRVGDQVVVLCGPGDSTTGSDVEEKILTGVGEQAGRPLLTWSPKVRNEDGGLVMRRWTRRFLLFGHDAPAGYLSFSVVDGNVVWAPRTTDFTAPAEPAVHLDSIVDGLEAGTEILLVTGQESDARARVTTARVLTVTGVGPAGAKIGEANATPALEATVTRLGLDLEPDTDVDVPDVRDAVVYELAGPAIPFWGFDYPPQIEGDSVHVSLTARPDLEGLGEPAAGRLVVLDDATARPQTVTVTGVDHDTPPDHLRLRFDPELERPLETATAVLFGNVARATHGETVVGEVLGDGDAATDLQAFRLAKPPVTYVPSPGAPRGAASTLRIEADGMVWEETATLFGRGPDERVYTLRRDDDGATVVRFGDGRTGARLPTGRGNVIAGYRAGLGLDGRVRAGTLTNPRTRPVGLRRVTNPGAASGGADPEPPEQTRVNAPSSVRTFGRIVSLRDFEDAAREFAGVAKARAAAIWDGEEQVARLTVAGAAGAEIGGTALQDLVADLDRRRDLTRTLHVVSHREVPIEVAATIEIASGHVPDAALAAARAALLDLFAFDRRDFGQPVHLSDVYRALQEATGVASARISRLRRKPSPGATDPPEIETPVPVGPSELVVLRDPANDLDVRIG